MISRLKRLVLSYRREMLGNGSTTASALALLLCLCALKIAGQPGTYTNCLAILKCAKGNLGDLLADPSVANRIWRQLDDPKFGEIWQDVATLGFVYQFFCTPARSEAVSDIQTANKELSVASLQSFTQLYTPTWVTDFLVANAVLERRLPAGIELNSLARFQKWLLSPAANLGSVRGIKVLDPACGGGNFLVSAAELIFQLLLLEGLPTEEAIVQAITSSVEGWDIDSTGLFVTRLSLVTLGLKNGLSLSNFPDLTFALSTPGNANDQDSLLLGSLDRKYNSAKDESFDCIVTNPPYLGRKLMSRKLKVLLSELYPRCKNDIANAFIERGLELVKPGGTLGYISQSSLLYLPSYKDMRQDLMRRAHLLSAVEAGSQVFPTHSGEKVASALYLWKKKVELEEETSPSIFIDLKSSKLKPLDLLCSVQSLHSQPRQLADNVFEREIKSFDEHENQSHNYRCPKVVIAVSGMLGKAGDQMEIKQGLATTDNARFVRFVWDVAEEEIGKRWLPYLKSAGSIAWHAPVKTLVNWQNDGAQIKEAATQAYPYLKGRIAWVVKNENYYFRPGLNFSFVSSSFLTVRKMPSGCIFDVGCSALFPKEQELDFMLGYFNSSLARAFSNLLNPTINTQVGDLKKLPLPELPAEAKGTIAELASRCFHLTQRLHSLSEPELLRKQAICNLLDGANSDQRKESYDSLVKELKEVEAQLNRAVLDATCSLLSLDGKERKELNQFAEANYIEKEQKKVLPTEAYFQTLSLIDELYNAAKDAPLVINQQSPILQSLIGNVQLGTDWSHYMRTQLPSQLSKMFMKSPPLICLPIPNEESYLLCSTKYLRSKISESSSTASSSYTSSYTTGIIEALIERLRSVVDWTGRDCLKVVDELNSSVAHVRSHSYPS